MRGGGGGGGGDGEGLMWVLVGEFGQFFEISVGLWVQKLSPFGNHFLPHPGSCCGTN